MIFSCCTSTRAELVRKHPTLNGIDFLEVLDDDAPDPQFRQRTILVRCFKPLLGDMTQQTRIEGGTRVRPVRVSWAWPASQVAAQGVLTPLEVAFIEETLLDPSSLLVVRTEVFGDFSTYTLRLTKDPNSSDPPADFDPRLSSVDFSFKAECQTQFDCLRPVSCPPTPPSNPRLDYLAKDFASFRQVMLDRMALLAPEWTERRTADLGMALVELLAYVGDSLSYQQDAIATEAYLHTARRRVSARRHARLVDYFMHDGSNARAWIQLTVEPGSLPLAVPQGLTFLTRAPSLQTPLVDASSEDLRRALSAGSQVFEAMGPSVLYPQHNRIRFYTWGDAACVLPKGATRATLRDGTTPEERLLLQSGDVLIFEEALGPETGEPADLDPTRRHAVRLTRVDPGADPLDEPPTPIVEIEWALEDALPFPFCISSRRTDLEHAGQVFDDVSIASGNILLADHGQTLGSDESLGKVPAPTLFTVPAEEPSLCEDPPRNPLIPRFRPTLKEGPITQIGQILLRRPDGTSETVPFDPLAPASSVFTWDLSRTLPAVRVTSEGSTAWAPRRDLLDSTPEDRHFVIEVEGDGTGTLRFGDGDHGRRPEEETSFAARYRVGNGKSGNVGAEVIIHLVVDPPPGGAFAASVLAIRNPLPARGGTDPETIEEVRQRAPFAFRTQERAVTLEDYSEMALRYPGLQGARARFRWTGSWRTVFVTLDPECRDTADPVSDLTRRVRDHLEKYRLAGYDLVVDDPKYVSLELELHVCVSPGYFAANVEEALLEVFTSGLQPDGSKGLFHPDRFVFGETVYLSPFLQAALAIDGVQDARLDLFRRQGQDDQGQALLAGRIELDRIEVARLDNDPSFPEHGTFQVSIGGGR